MANNKKKKKLVSSVADRINDRVAASRRVTAVPEASAALANDDHADETDAARELETVRAKLHSESEKVAGLEAELKARNAAHSSLQQRCEALTEELEDLRATDVDHAKALEKAEDELRARQDYLQTASEEITGLLTTIAEKDSAKALLEKQYAKLQRQLEGQRVNRDEKDSASKADTQQPKNGKQDSETPSNDRPANGVLEDAPGSDVQKIQAQITRTEKYADTLRHNLADLTKSYDEAVLQRDKLSRSLEQMTDNNRELSEEIARANASIAEMQDAIQHPKQKLAEQQAAFDQLQAKHERDIHELRNELIDAQDAIAEADDMNERLASELMQVREAREGLESTLSHNEERAKDRIEDLEKQIRELTRSNEDFEHKLDARSTAIQSLLGELARKSGRIDSASKIQQVVDNLDDSLSARLADESASEDMEPEDHIVLAGDEAEKVTRVLVGNVGNKVLRFSLSKDRVTIGRTRENDIRIKTSFISRQHAVILTEGDRTRVIDSGSRNGVFVNSKRVKERALSNGDIVTIGDASLRYMERHERQA